MKTIFLFFVIVNNISYNKLEVENIIFKKLKYFFKKEGFFKPCVEKYVLITKNYEKEEKVVNKKIIIKGALLLIVLAVLSIGFGGCGIVISTTGTVYITASIPGIYEIWMDNTFLGTTNSSGILVAYNISQGYHFFEADGHDYGWWDWWWYWNYYYGSTNKTIYAGISNNVTIPVYLYYY